MSQSKRISSGLGKAMALFVSVPLTALPAAAQSVSAGRTSIRAGASGIRAGFRIEGPIPEPEKSSDCLECKDAGKPAAFRAGHPVGIRANGCTPPGIDGIKTADKCTP